jgi:hypothetical protein
MPVLTLTWKRHQCDAFLILNFGEVSNLAQIPSFNARTLSQRMEGAMHESQRYRCNAGDCLLAARKSPEPHYQKLYLLMAQSWLSLAHQDDASDELLASWGIVEPIKADGIVLPFPAAGRG